MAKQARHVFDGVSNVELNDVRLDSDGRKCQSNARRIHRLFAPYGYKKISKQLFPADDDTPNVVKRIFDLYLEGKMGLQAIANLLTDEGIPSPANNSK